MDREAEASLERHLSSLEAFTPRELYQLVIIDNGSSFGSESMERKADIYVRKERRMGYAGAVNLGMHIADGDYFCTTNNDVYFTHHGWLERMVETESKHPGIIMAGNAGVSDRVWFDDPWMSLWLVSRKTWQTIGDFDQHVLNWRYHDQEWNIKARSAGLNSVRDGGVHLDFVNSMTYSKLDVGAEEGEEAREMLRRYGATMYVDWLSKNRANLEKQ